MSVYHTVSKLRLCAVEWGMVEPLRQNEIEMSGKIHDLYIKAL